MLTVAKLADWYDEFNGEFFGGELEFPTNGFEITKRKSYLGQFHWSGHRCYGGKCVIKISTFYNRSDDDYRATLLHEMIHYWQWYYGYKNGHGYYFKRKAAEINRETNNKYAIARTTTLSNEVKESAPKRVSCNPIVVYRYKGEPVFSVLTNNSLRTIPKWFEKINGVSDVKYYSTCGTKLSNYRKSVKIIHYIKMPDDVYENIVKPSIVKELHIAA